MLIKLCKGEITLEDAFVQALEDPEAIQDPKSMSTMPLTQEDLSPSPPAAGHSEEAANPSISDAMIEEVNDPSSSFAPTEEASAPSV